MAYDPKSRPGARVADERGQRLLTGLETLLAQGSVVFTSTELAEQSQVTRQMAKIAIQNWIEQGWIEKINSQHYIIRELTPFAPSNVALDTAGLLKSISETAFRLGRLTYGYASALQMHGLTELIPESIFVFQTAPAISPPKIPAHVPFQRSTKLPKEWGTWNGKTVYVSRRHPSMLRPYQRMMVDVHGMKIPCTTPIKTLLDCWVRPDLSGGADRVADAWNEYLSRNDDHETIASDLKAILTDSGWESFRIAFLSWIQSEHPALHVH